MSLSARYTAIVTGCEPLLIQYSHRQIAESVEKKHDVLTLTVNAVSHLSSQCGDIVAHEALAVRMAFLVSFPPVHCQGC